MLSLILVAALGATDCQVGSCVGDGFEVWDGRDLGCCFDPSSRIAPLAPTSAPLVRFIGEEKTSCADPNALAVVARILRDCGERVPPETTVYIFADWSEAAAAFRLRTDRTEVLKCFVGKTVALPSPGIGDRSCSVDAHFMAPRTMRTPPSCIEEPLVANRSLRDSARADSLRLYDAGVRLMTDNKNVEALTILEKCVAADPVAALCHRALGIAYAREKNGPKAAKHYRLYLTSSPDSPDKAELKPKLFHGRDDY